MKRTSIPIGSEVSYKTGTGHPARGRVIQVLTEKRQPSIVLIERPDTGRAFRFENEVTVLSMPPAQAQAHAPALEPEPVAVGVGFGVDDDIDMHDDDAGDN